MLRDVVSPPLLTFSPGSVIAVLFVARSPELGAIFDALPYLKPPRPARSCVLVGGAYSNAGHQKSHLARESVLFFPSEQVGVVGCEEGDPLHTNTAKS